jgi:hypothetical protein
MELKNLFRRLFGNFVVAVEKVMHDQFDVYSVLSLRNESRPKATRAFRPFSALGIPFQILAMMLIIEAVFFLNPVSAQYATQYPAPTAWGLDREVGVFEKLPLVSWQSGVKLQFDYGVGTALEISNKKSGTTVRELLAQIDAGTRYKTLIRDWEVLVVSDVEEKRFEEYDAIVKDLEHARRELVIDELLAWSHPSVYPTLFWVMKNDSLENARKVSRSLLSNHGVMMNYSPSFEGCLEGFERALKGEESKYLSLAYNLPQPILKDVDCKALLSGGSNEYLEQRVELAKMTFADMKREYLKAPPSPRSWPLCGTGYVHTMNHADYSIMIGDLRTEEAYGFLITQAKKLAEQNDAANQKKMAELAMALAKSDSDAALEILNVIAQQQKLENSALVLGPQSNPLSNSVFVQMLGVINATGHAKYNQVIRLFCNSADVSVRRTAFSILRYRNETGLFEIGVRGLERIAEHAKSGKTQNERDVAEHSRFLAASVLSILSDKEVDAYFRLRLDQPENAKEAAGYLSVAPGNHSTATLKKILALDGLPAMTLINIRLALLDRRDKPTVVEVLKRLETRYAELHEAFQYAHQNVMDPNKFNGFLVYLDPDIEKLRSFSEVVERGVELMDAKNSADERMTGVIMVYTSARSLITEKTIKSLRQFEDDQDERIGKIAKALLDAQ